jgi:hypothetical protein
MYIVCVRVCMYVYAQPNHTNCKQTAIIVLLARTCAHAYAAVCHVYMRARASVNTGERMSSKHGELSALGFVIVTQSCGKGY